MNIRILLLAIPIYLNSCTKDHTEPAKEPIKYTLSSTLVKYKLILSHDTIIEYSKYHNNQLYLTKHFYFNDTTGEIITKNAGGIVTGKMNYEKGSNGFAESAVDSVFSDSGAFISLSVITYDYDTNGYLFRTIDSGNYIYGYTINNNNITRTHFSSCSHGFSFNNYLTTIDVWDFKNKIFGNPSTNLVSHASWYDSCPCGPSRIPASSSFTYEFNGNGYVTKKVEYYIHCYSQGTVPLGDIYTTLFEY